MTRYLMSRVIVDDDNMTWPEAALVVLDDDLVMNIWDLYNRLMDIRREDEDVYALIKSSERAIFFDMPDCDEAFEFMDSLDLEHGWVVLDELPEWLPMEAIQKKSVDVMHAWLVIGDSVFQWKAYLKDTTIEVATDVIPYEGVVIEVNVDASQDAG